MSNGCESGPTAPAEASGWVFGRGDRLRSPAVTAFHPRPGRASRQNTRSPWLGNVSLKIHCIMQASKQLNNASLIDAKEQDMARRSAGLPDVHGPNTNAQLVACSSACRVPSHHIERFAYERSVLTSLVIPPALPRVLQHRSNVVFRPRRTNEPSHRQKLKASQRAGFGHHFFDGRLHTEPRV